MGGGFEPIVGAAHVQAPLAADLDGAPISQVISPADADEVAECMRLATLDSIPLVVRGGGSKLCWGNVGAAATWVVLDVSRLSTSIEIDVDEGIAQVAAGVRTSVLEARLSELGRRTQIPEGHVGSTVGGSVAADPPGARRTLDTALRHDLLGLEVVLADGSRTRCGARVVKNVTGFDLVRLYCGSFGTLGVLTEITLRLRPLPAVQRCLHRRLRTIEEAQRVISQLSARGVQADGALVRAAGEAEVLWLLEGSDSDVRERSERVTGDELEPSAWAAAARPVPAEPASDRAVIRVCGRPSDVAEIWRSLESFAGAASVGPAFPLTGVVWARVNPKQLSALCAHASARSWTWLIESLPTAQKRGRDVFGPASSALPLLRLIKQRFDPRGVLAPGRFMAGI